jgi:hypothetical protein
MARVNVILLAFILISWTVFKALILNSAMVSGITGAFIGFSTDCEPNHYVENKKVCLHISFTNLDTVPVEGLDAIADVLYNIGVYFIAIIKFLVSLLLTVFAVIIDIVVLFTLYIVIGMTPIPGAPLPVNAIIVVPFVLANFALVLGFFTGD